MPLDVSGATVNYHLTQKCNYQCRYCFCHFKNVIKEEVLSLGDSKAVIDRLPDAGIYKINFAGGEPFLNKHLGELIKHAGQQGLKTSVVTNGSLITPKWISDHGPYLDQIGISCDSANEETLKRLRSGKGDHVHKTREAFKLLKQFNQNEEHPIRLKLNTVITRLNVDEDMSDFVLELGVERWKIFQMAEVDGENNHECEQLSVPSEMFDRFVNRHQTLKKYGVSVIPETGVEMENSYIMINPMGRFYQNVDSAYQSSQPILDIGFDVALSQVGFSIDRFEARSGSYQL